MPDPNANAGDQEAWAELVKAGLVKALPHAVVCYTQCWSCQFGCHFGPPKVHTWMDKEDAEHAGHPWPLPAEIAAANRCACDCAAPTREDRP